MMKELDISKGTKVEYSNTNNTTDTAYEREVVDKIVLDGWTKGHRGEGIYDSRETTKGPEGEEERENEKSDKMGGKEGFTAIRAVRTDQDEGIRHMRTKSYGTSLLDMMNARSGDYGRRTWRFYDNEEMPTTQFERLGLKNTGENKMDVGSRGREEMRMGMEKERQRGEGFGGPIAEISNESIFGLPPGIQHPPPGLEDGTVRAKETEGSNEVNERAVGSSVVYGIAEENVWGSDSVAVPTRVNKDFGMGYLDQGSETVIGKEKGVGSGEKEREMKSVEGVEGTAINRGISAPDTWDNWRTTKARLQGYSFGDTARNDKLNFSSLGQGMEFKAHARSHTLGNATDVDNFIGRRPLEGLGTAGIRGYLGRMGTGFGYDMEYNENEMAPQAQMLGNRHLRQGSLNFLGQGDAMRMGRGKPATTLSHDVSVSGSNESNFSAVGRAGTSGLLHGIGLGDSRHISSMSLSGSIGSIGELAPTRSLWVGNLDLAITPRELISMFGKYGRIESLRTLPDKECAFINFMRLEDAMRAHDEMQGGMVGNCTVRVGYGRGEGYASSDAQAMQPTRALWVGNISPNTTAGSLRQLFEQFGAVESARILTQKNCGFVNFERLEDSVRAKQATNGKELDGMVLRIGYAKVPLKGVEGHHRLRNMIPTAPPLTMSGRIAEANAILGTSTVGLGNEDVLEPGVPAMDEQLVAFPYVTSLPPLPESRDLPFSQAKLREMRKRLDVQCPSGEFDAIFNESLHVLAELCTDYVGNMLVQRLAERATSAQKLAMISAVSRHIAAIGVHKNGTWAIQKLIDCCSSADQQSAIVDALRPFIPQLLLDQLGNYVVQCCLPFADGRNQFIFEAIHARCWEIAQGRFGARAIRTCLEHPNTSRSQQKLVAVSLVLDSVSLATNPNGNILITWLLDISAFPGRFRVLAPQLACHLRHLCTHKLGSTSILKLIDQRQEPDARDLLLNTLFFNPEPQVLEDIVSDQVHGASLVLRILSCSNIDDIEKLRISVRVQASLQPLQKQGVQGYQKLADLVDSILISSNKLSLQPSISSSSSSSSSIPQADPISSITITLQNSDLYSSPSNNNGSTPDSFLPTSQSNNPTNQQYFSSSILSSSYVNFSN